MARRSVLVGRLARAVAGSVVILLMAVSVASCSGGSGATASTTTTTTMVATTSSTDAGGIVPGSVGGSVAILGDSITRQGSSVLADVLGSTWDLRVDGKDGYTVLGQTPAGRNLAEGDPEQVIINLGTNDVFFDRYDLPTSAVQMANLLGFFAGARCIHLVTVNEHMGPDPALAPRARTFNESLRRLAAADPRIHLLDVNAVFAAAQADPSVAKPLFDSDTIHPTTNGHRVLAEAYDAALRSCPAPIG